MAGWNVQRLRRPQMGTAAGALVRAFRDDPLARFMQPDESKIDSFNLWFFEKTLNYGLKWGETWTDTDAQSAAAWLPPGQTDMTWWRTMRAGFAWLPFKVGLSGMARFNKLDSVLGRMRKASVAGPFWYEGPDYEDRHEFYPERPFDPRKYSDNFSVEVFDFN